MNEQLLGGLKSLVGVGAGIANNIAANKQQKRAIRFQRDENEKARKFNKETFDCQY